MIRVIALLCALWLTGTAAAQPAVTHGAEDAPQRYTFLSLVTCTHCVDLYAALVDGDVPATARDEAAALHKALTDGDLALDVHFVLSDRRDLWAALLIGCSADAVEAHRRLMLTEENWRTVTFAHPENGFVLIPEDRSLRVMRALLTPDLLSAESFDACLSDRPRAEAVILASQAAYAEAEDLLTADDTMGFPSAIVAGRLEKPAEPILRAIAADLGLR